MFALKGSNAWVLETLYYNLVQTRVNTNKHKHVLVLIGLPHASDL